MAIVKKVGAIILNHERNRIAVVRKRGRDVFIIPGGRPEPGESDLETLARELQEELSVEVTNSAFFGEYCEPAEFGEGQLTMRVFEVSVSGEFRVDNEIEEAIWVAGDEGEVRLGSTLVNHVVPALRERGDL